MDKGIRLAARQIAKTYGRKAVLTGINLEVSPGQTVALVGANGCGKSTLIKILAGLTRPDTGTVKAEPSVRKAMITDRYDKTNFTIPKFMSYILQMEDKEHIALSPEELYGMFSLENMLNTPMKYLSKGTLQKVAVLQALIGKRDLMFMDEPLSGQDYMSRSNFIKEIKRRTNMGMSVVMACHEPELIDALADTVYQIKNTRLEDGSSYFRRGAEADGYVIAEDGPALRDVLNRFKNNDKRLGVSRQGNYIRIGTDAVTAGELLVELMQQGTHVVKFEEVGGHDAGIDTV
ncbi:ATP-binding cassette domain-containing protein [Anaerolentibacter hominis]|uniref:ABC transporter ATP-binding protein n=1 Tax=Anaerolentibacter hominis TaxID=3079009 RepID=UPI0031B86118